MRTWLATLIALAGACDASRQPHLDKVSGEVPTSFETYQAKTSFRRAFPLPAGADGVRAVFANVTVAGEAGDAALVDVALCAGNEALDCVGHVTEYDGYVIPVEGLYLTLPWDHLDGPCDLLVVAYTVPANAKVAMTTQAGCVAQDLGSGCGAPAPEVPYLVQIDVLVDSEKVLR
jgi:hypothetical protein